eukprot:170945_1
MENHNAMNVNGGKAGGRPKKSKKTVEQTYQKKTQLEHILLRPDTYIGSILRETQNIFVLNDAGKRMEQQKISYVPGLYKIFDEILVNAADNKQRDPTMSEIAVEIDIPKNRVSVYNNGQGIPVVVHQKHKCYVPELIFGHLLTGSNFDDSERKTTGGRNGFGGKLANIFSSKFVVETADGQRGKRYKQTFRSNMSSKGEPHISAYSGSDWTRITFTPDLAKFKMARLDADTVKLFTRRVYDIAGTTAKCRVSLNGKRLPVRSFADYCRMFLPEDAEIVKHKSANGRWEVCLSISDGRFEQLSFVNSICTLSGGTHVNTVADAIAKHVCATLPKKHGVKLKPFHVKNYIWLFVNALIENPAFTSQTKEKLITPARAFGSKPDINEKFLKAVTATSLVERVVRFAQFKQSKELKKSDGKKEKTLHGIDKLEDANDAGTRYSAECTLIVCEGDSAKLLAMAGFSVVGRDRWGVFPIRGKLLNVREASHKVVMNNKEITNLKKILGLKNNADYSSDTNAGQRNFNALRYGKLAIMADQDLDGSHIKGLLMNFFHFYVPTLLQRDGFLWEFITPIVKCRKGKGKGAREIAFYTLPQFKTWLAENNDGRGWTTKYYKGLGTSTNLEAKQYFQAIDRHLIDFVWGGEEDTRSIKLAFAKSQADARKAWLAAMDPDVFLDHFVGDLSYSDFINKDLILFSQYDNQRSIPSLVDGLKPAQRKILFACFKRKLVREIRVEQLAGYVSEHAAYHHGEASLNGAIIGMAHNFVGSNNVNLLMPNGQFGSRHLNGKDAASPRYIHTCLAPITRNIYNEMDDCILKSQFDDGQRIEPEWYCPVLPMILVNGAEGIGTGWSTFVPKYNPREIIANLRRMLSGLDPVEMHPWYKNWTGTMHIVDEQRYLVSGLISELAENLLHISELPVGRSTLSCKKHLEDFQQKSKLSDLRDYSTTNTVSFTFSQCSETGEKIYSAISPALFKKFKLSASLSTTNMVLFNAAGRLHRYSGPLEILQEFFALRLEFYEKRKRVHVAKLKDEFRRLSNKARFILAVISGEVVVTNVRKVRLEARLTELKFDKFAKARVNWSEEKEEESGGKSFDYLLSMPIQSLTKEKVDEIQKQRDDKMSQLKKLQATSSQALWRVDLDDLEKALEAHESAEKEEPEFAVEYDGAQKKRKKKRKGPRALKKQPKTKPPPRVRTKQLTALMSEDPQLAKEFNMKPRALKQPVKFTLSSSVGSSGSAPSDARSAAPNDGVVCMSDVDGWLSSDVGASSAVAPKVKKPRKLGPRPSKKSSKSKSSSKSSLAPSDVSSAAPNDFSSAPPNDGIVCMSDVDGWLSSDVGASSAAAAPEVKKPRKLASKPSKKSSSKPISSKVPAVAVAKPKTAPKKKKKKDKVESVFRRLSLKGSDSDDETPLSLAERLKRRQLSSAMPIRRRSPSPSSSETDLDSDTGSRRVEAGSRPVATGSRQIEAGSRRVETGSRHVITGSRLGEQVSSRTVSSREDVQSREEGSRLSDFPVALSDQDSFGSLSPVKNRSKKSSPKRAYSSPKKSSSMSEQSFQFESSGSEGVVADLEAAARRRRAEIINLSSDEEEGSSKPSSSVVAMQKRKKAPKRVQRKKNLIGDSDDETNPKFPTSTPGQPSPQAKRRKLQKHSQKKLDFTMDTGEQHFSQFPGQEQSKKRAKSSAIRRSNVSVSSGEFQDQRIQNRIRNGRIRNRATVNYVESGSESDFEISEAEFEGHSNSDSSEDSE